MKDSSSSSDRVLAPLQAAYKEGFEAGQSQMRAVAVSHCSYGFEAYWAKSQTLKHLDTVVARLRSQPIENKDDEDARVAPSVPCVEPIGSTADGEPGVQSSPAPEFEELWPESLLRHVVKAPSQYDASCRAMAAEILRLRSQLAEALALYEANHG